MPTELVSVEATAELIGRHLDRREAGAGRLVVGIVGAPGAGKSTLATGLERILTAGGTTTALLPMDGFHLPQAELVRLGRRDRMGAADTFDTAGFVSTLRDVRSARAEVLAPGFDRDVEEPVPAAIRIPSTARVVITEGNWLLLAEDGWGEVGGLLDLTIAVAVDDAIRVPRLVARHVAHGKSPAAAAAWVQRSDEANAARILPTLALADVVVRLP